MGFAWVVRAGALASCVSPEDLTPAPTPLLLASNGRAWRGAPNFLPATAVLGTLGSVWRALLAVGGNIGTRWARKPRLEIRPTLNAWRVGHLFGVGL